MRVGSIERIWPIMAASASWAGNTVIRQSGAVSPWSPNPVRGIAANWHTRFALATRHAAISGTKAN